jgi:hypothetical protein
MESNNGHRSGLLTAGGILSIISGAFEVVGGGALVGLMLSPAVRRALFNPIHSGFFVVGPASPASSTRLIIVGVSLLVLGAIAIAGGVSATRRKSFGLSLAAAICALPSVIFGLSLAGVIPALSSLYSAITSLGRGTAIFSTSPSVILGILAVIFVALGKREFGAKVAQNATSLTERSTVFPARV